VSTPKRFLEALRGETDRRKNADHRRPVREGVRRGSAEAPNVDWLAQGAIYPDVIESAGGKTGKAHVINRITASAGCRPTAHEARRAAARLFKDEVRRLGVEPAMPREMVYRHPFPGPGLGFASSAKWQGLCGPPAPGRRIFIEELPPRPLRQDLAGLRRVPAGAFGGSHG
jgi:GMP synthase (glutamine-hydrolysing)